MSRRPSPPIHSEMLRSKADKAEKLARVEYIIERIDHRLAWAELNSVPDDLPDMVRTLVAHIREGGE